jgi:metal-responsive CopG/Arc/MetJ family transcriptional regulator
MTAKKQIESRTEKAAMPRASVTFPHDLYRTLEALARKKKVSIAWVVRDAAERYVADEKRSFENGLLRKGN